MKGRFGLIESLLSVIVMISIVLASIVTSGTTTLADESEAVVEQQRDPLEIIATDIRDYDEHWTFFDIYNNDKLVIMFFGDLVGCYNSINTLKELADVYNTYLDADSVTVCIYSTSYLDPNNLPESVSNLPDDFYLMNLSKQLESVYEIKAGLERLCQNYTPPIIGYFTKDGKVAGYTYGRRTGDSILPRIVKAGLPEKEIGLPIAEFDGVKNYDKAQEMCELFNNERQNAGKPELIISKELTDAAMQRAAEQVICDYLCVRPDFTFFTTVSDNAKEEFIRFVSDSAEEAYCYWRDNDCLSSILEDKYNSIGIGAVEVQGETIWICELSSDDSSINTTLEGIEESTFEIPFRDCKAIYASIYAEDGYIIHENETVEINFHSNFYGFDLKSVKNLTYSVSDPDLIQFDSDNLTVKALKSSGTATLTITAENGYESICKVYLREAPTISPIETPDETDSNKEEEITPTPEITQIPSEAPIVEPSKIPTIEPTKTPTVEEFAERLYTTCLGRPAEKEGKNYWVGELKAGNPGAEVAEGFFFSPEYENRKLNNKDFIGTLYETFMGRTPADSEVTYWSLEMKSGKSRKDIFDGFVNSPEWADICLTYGIKSGGLAMPTFEKEASPDVKAFAERLYTTCLGRKAETYGLEWWASELANLRQTGTVAASGFFNSPEFISLKTSDSEYVTRLYKTFMGREPEEAGFKFWIGELKAGKDRQYVFDGFSSAPEFANLCAEAGIMR